MIMALSMNHLIIASLFISAIQILLVKGTMKRPCKFGDKIEYGRLGMEVKLRGGLDAYVSHPKNSSSLGGVIVIQDIFGWTSSNTRAIVDMLMDNGFTAILPDAFEGKPAWNRSAAFGDFFAFMSQRRPSAVGNVVNASMEYLRDEFAITNVAMVGFCWGGGAVHHMTAIRSDIIAGVACYGIMDEDNPGYGLLNAPTLFIFGGADRVIPNKEVISLRRALRREADAKFAIRKYAGQSHGFVHRKIPSSDDPNKETIYAARKKMIRWLRRYLSK